MIAVLRKLVEAGDKTARPEQQDPELARWLNQHNLTLG